VEGQDIIEQKEGERKRGKREREKEREGGMK